MAPTPASFEKLGSFYLGAAASADGPARLDEPVLYDANDLTTHAVALGMTGSGKTGLGVALIEEAILDGIPVLALDPKGDLGNLLLSFPDLAPADFRPWVDEGSARREGRTADEQAKFLAKLWRDGLAEWGQDGQRIRAFREAADFAVYTPGSNAGRPISALASLSAPPASVIADPEALRDRIAGCVGGLLGLLDIDADPVTSRESMLLSLLLEHAWTRDESHDIASLIRAVQTPPVEQVGVFDLETFYPQKDRFALAMRLNSFLASPGFAAWSQGEPLDIASLLFTPDGRPRLSVLSIAHLDEQERMFFVTLLLNELLAWSRTQPGTTTLRALVYMDEVYGFLPPVANPPSKKPMLTLLKQARASGLGVCLATQNPADLDYKALSNIGTWFLGRLQTERDKMRVLEGLEQIGGESGFSRQELDTLLSGLESRRFLLRNVHEDAPALLQVRWVMSYLAGPMTREQIRRLEPDVPAATAPTPATAPSPEREAVATPGTPEPDTLPPALAPSIAQFFLAGRSAGRTFYRPAIVGRATLHHANARAKVDEWSEIALLARLGDRPPANIWDEAEALARPREDWHDEPVDGASFGSLASAAQDVKSYRRWKKTLKSSLYRDRMMTLLRCPSLKLVSKPGEPEGQFRARVLERVREDRDLAIAKLRKKYAPKLARLADRIRTAEEKVERETDQLGQQKMSAAINIGATLMGALFGRKLRSVSNVTRAGSAMRSVGRSSKERRDIERANERLSVLQEKLESMNQELEGQLAGLRDGAGQDTPPVEELRIAPRKSDLVIEELGILWLPFRIDNDGIAERNW